MHHRIAERRGRSPRSLSIRVAAASLREQIEADIDRLIGLLDALDGDPDLEPSLGAPLPGYYTTCDLEGDDSDFEPSLGWEEVHTVPRKQFG